MEKLTVKESAEIRASLYDTTLTALNEAGYATETFKGGALIHLPNGYFAKVSISICDASKFDIEATRAEYQAQLEARAEAAAKAAAKAAEKEAKAAEKAAKEAAKAVE